MPITLRRAESKFFVQFAGYTPLKDVVKNAGFRFNGAATRWESNDPRVVLGLAARTDVQVTAEAAEAIAGMRAAAAEQANHATRSIIASSAISSSVEIPVPAGLDYLNYQKAGIAYAMGRPNTLIADEMGLGKTIQAIGVVNADEKARRVLIVCPASLKLNWKREFERWDVKGLTVGIATSKGLPAADVCIVNYETVAKHRPAIDAVAWDVLVVDEAHYLKNPKAQRTVAVLGGSKKKVAPIVAGRRVFLTGTPIVNKPVELWPVVRSLDPSGLGAMGYFDFARRYCAGFQDRFAFNASGASNLEELQARLRGSIMIRRLKKDVLKDLPAKRRQLLPFEPNAEIKRILKAMETSHVANEKRLKALRAQAKAREGEDDKEAYAAIAREIQSATKVAFTEMSRHRHALAVAKAPIVVEHVREALESQECLLVMAHHQDVVEAIVAALEADGVSCSIVTGSTPVEERQAQVDAFQAGKTRVFVGTIRAAGVGLTLTRASHVVFAELDWTPGNVSQAEDRVHRIGQTKSVLIQHLIVDGTLDAKFVTTLVQKQRIIDKGLDDGCGESMAVLAEELFAVEDVEVEAAMTEDEADRAFEDELAALEEELERKHERQHAEQEERRKRFEAEHASLLDDLDASPEGAGEAAFEALEILAALDGDFAREENGVGFSKAHSAVGHRLAGTPIYARDRIRSAFALKLARIYRRQLPDDLRSRIT